MKHLIRILLFSVLLSVFAVPTLAQDCGLEPAEGVELSGCNLMQSDFAGANLSDANLSESNLLETSFIGANLAFADLSASNLINVDMTDANLTGASLAGSNLIGANFTNANLSGVNLSGANISNANFEGADLTFAFLELGAMELFEILVDVEALIESNPSAACILSITETDVAPLDVMTCIEVLSATVSTTVEE